MTSALKTIGIGAIVTILSILVGVPIWLVYSGTIVVGGLSDNPVLLGVLMLAAIPVAFFITGWAAITGVRFGK